MATFICKQYYIWKHIILLRVNHYKMIDPTCISTTGILCCVTHKYMLLAKKSVEHINRWSGG
jgi:hypothetical protein